jgi:hypothetical protein
MDIEKVYNKLIKTEQYHIDRMLDEKIVQYIKRKHEYMNKNPTISIEHAYNITNYDIDRINLFMRTNLSEKMDIPGEMVSKYAQKPAIMYNERLYFDNNDINEKIVDFHNQSHMSGMNKLADKLPINDECDLLQGLPSRSFKSYGFRNLHEHYFQYISDDIQNNIELPFPRGGISCRNNKKSNIK